MRERNDKIDGPFTVTEDTAFHGMVTADATVRSQVTLKLHGMVVGDLLVEPHANAIVHGTVNGVVRNRGGTVAIHGTVGGISDEDASARTSVMPGALIGP